MGLKSAIEWVTATWNPLTGCTKVSPGCAHCYAERLSHRLMLMGQPNYRNDFKVTLHERMLAQPTRWKSPQRIFVNSMSDLYHKDVPFEFIARVFEVMVKCPRHQFKILTKRAERLEDLSPRLPWPDNVWQGVSVENADYTFRIDHLRRTGARRNSFRSSHYLARFRISTCKALTGLSSEVRAVQELVRCHRNGLKRL